LLLSFKTKHCADRAHLSPSALCC